MRVACSRADPMRSRSRTSDSSFRSLRPCCWPPRMVPSRRSERSSSESSKPSDVAATASRRARPGCPGRQLGDEQAPARRRSTTDPAAELVELRDAEPLGVHDHHDRRVRDVDADLDHGRRDEHVDSTVGERAHRRVLGRHWAFARAGSRPEGRAGSRRPAAEPSSRTPMGGRSRRACAARSLALRRTRGCRTRCRIASSRSSSACVGIVGLVTADPRTHDVGLVTGRRPRRAPAATPASTHSGFPASGATAVVIGARPFGNSSRVETSRSP